MYGSGWGSSDGVGSYPHSYPRPLSSALPYAAVPAGHARGTRYPIGTRTYPAGIQCVPAGTPRIPTRTPRVPHGYPQIPRGYTAGTRGYPPWYPAVAPRMPRTLVSQHHPPRACLTQRGLGAKTTSESRTH